MEKEDIPFKTLSEGLGFYSKVPLLRKTVEKNQAFRQSQKKPLPSVPDILFSKSLDLNNGGTYEKFRKSLSQAWLEDSPPQDPPPPTPPLPALQKTEENFQQSSLKSALKPLEKAPGFSLKSLMADSLISMLLFFCPLIVFSVFTQARPFHTLFALWPGVLAAFFVFYHIYSLLCRLFCFDTYGESLSHRRLCSKEGHIPHPTLLFLRSLVSCLTLGTLPLFSLILKKDLLSLLTRLDFKDTSFQDKQLF